MDETNEPIAEEQKDKNMKYFLVVYLTNNSVHLYQGDTKEECKKFEEEWKNNPKFKDRIKAFRYIKRNLNNYQDGLFL